MNEILFGNYEMKSGISASRTIGSVTRAHEGLDYAVPVGTQIQSTTNGKVVYTGYNAGGYGKYIKVQDIDGNSHIYAHLSEILVNQGDEVTRYSVIGLSGNTGRTTGPHLHYEVKDSAGNVLDGTDFIGEVSGDPEIVLENPTTSGKYSVSNMGLGSKVQNALSTIIVFIVLFGVGVLGVVAFIKAFDIEIPYISDITNLVKGDK